MSNHSHITVSDMNRAVIACKRMSVREAKAGRIAESLAYEITALKNDRDRKRILGEEMPNYTRMIREREKRIELIRQRGGSSEKPIYPISHPGDRAV